MGQTYNGTLASHRHNNSLNDTEKIIKQNTENTYLDKKRIKTKNGEKLITTLEDKGNEEEF